MPDNEVPLNPRTIKHTMQSKPWTFKEGFILGGGILAVGVALEVGTGPVAWSRFAWPVNVITLSAFIALIAIAYLLRKKVAALHFLGTYAAAVPALVYAAVLTIIMGLTRQDASGGWFSDMLTFWPFVLTYTYIAFILGFISLRRLLAFRFQRPTLRRDIFFLLNHLGLFIALTCGTLGNADLQRLQMMTVVGEPERRAMNADFRVVELPFSIELKRFILEEYADGSPRRFASDLHVLTASGKALTATVDVNHPVEVEGWKIYQYGYDTALGAQSRTSILELVRDPWLPAVYAGIFMMLAGAVGLFFGKHQ